MEEGIIELDDVLVAELVEDVDLNGKIGELLQIYGIQRTLITISQWETTEISICKEEKI